MAKQKKSVSFVRSVETGKIIDVPVDEPVISSLYVCDPFCPYLGGFTKDLKPKICTATFPCLCKKNGKPTLLVTKINSNFCDL